MLFYEAMRENFLHFKKKPSIYVGKRNSQINKDE